LIECQRVVHALESETTAETRAGAWECKSAAAEHGLTGVARLPRRRDLAVACIA
jgi:hypothetical protein